MALTDNWEASWRFNNDWTDSSNGINGSAIGATFSSSTRKLGSHSSAYDGIDDAGNFGDVLNSVIAGADKKWSFAFWVYLNNLDDNHGVFSKYGDSSHSEDQRQFFCYITTAGVIVFRTYFDLGLGNVHREYTTPATTIASAGWHLIRGTYDGSIDTNDGLDRVTIKVDNVNKAIGMTGNGALGDIPSGTARLATGGLIGSSGSTVVLPMDGFIDQGEVWSKILTSQDDTDLWNSGVGIESILIARAPSMLTLLGVGRA